MKPAGGDDLPATNVELPSLLEVALAVDSLGNPVNQLGQPLVMQPDLAVGETVPTLRISRFL